MGARISLARFAYRTAPHKKADAGKKPESLVGHSRSGRKRGFKHHTCDLPVDCQMSGDSSAEGLAEGNDHFAIDTFCVHKVFVSGFGILVEAGFARFSFAVAVTAVFQGKYVYMCVMEKFIDGCAVGDVGGVTVKSEKSKSRLLVRNPPRVELDPVRGCEPNVFDRQSARMSIAFETAGVVRKKDQVRFEHADNR